MGPEFVLRGYPRRIARAVVDAMVPRWPEFDVDLTDDVLADVERTLRGYPPIIQVAILGSLFGLEFLSPLFGPGLKPLSRSERHIAIARLETIANHPIPQIRMLVMLLQVTISFAAYSRPDVEAFLGYRRREWRETRQALRARLLAADPAKLPAVPAPLADGRVVTPAEFLSFLAALADGHAEQAAG